MNKKADMVLGQSFVIIFITFIIVALGIFVVTYMSSLSQLPDQKISPLTNLLYVEQLTGNPACFAYENPRTGRVDRGVLDLRKITNATFNNCLTLGDTKYVSAQMLITIFENPPQTKVFSTLAWGGAAMTVDKFTKNVFVTDGTTTTKAQISIQIN